MMAGCGFLSEAGDSLWETLISSAFKSTPIMQKQSLLAFSYLCAYLAISAQRQLSLRIISYLYAEIGISARI